MDIVHSAFGGSTVGGKSRREDGDGAGYDGAAGLEDSDELWAEMAAKGGVDFFEKEDGGIVGVGVNEILHALGGIAGVEAAGIGVDGEHVDDDSVGRQAERDESTDTSVDASDAAVRGAGEIVCENEDARHG
jgi:hypothetical protein